MLTSILLELCHQTSMVWELHCQARIRFTLHVHDIAGWWHWPQVTDKLSGVGARDEEQWPPMDLGSPLYWSVVRAADRVGWAERREHTNGNNCHCIDKWTATPLKCSPHKSISSFSSLILNLLDDMQLCTNIHLSWQHCQKISQYAIVVPQHSYFST